MSTARIDELRSKFDENPRRYFAPLANEYRKAGDLTQAIALCREHLPKQPGHMSGYIVFGQALYEDGELAEAQDVFQSALELDPENLIALRHLGDIARTRGDAGAARRWYERVLDADPRNDDIAALLETLAQRHTPRAATPIASVSVVLDEPAAFGAEAIDDDPFSAPDSPAWHTPSFLTPLASAAVPAEPETGDAEMRDEVVGEAGAEHLLDLDFSAEALTAEVAEEVEAEPRLIEAHADAISEANADGDGAGNVAEVAGAESDALTAALGAFAAHDPIEMASTLPMLDAEPASWAPRSAADESELDDSTAGETAVEARDVARAEPDEVALDELSSSAAAAPFMYLPETYGDDETFEEGLVAQQWPDASSLPGRLHSPSRGVTPISSEAVSDAFGEAALDDEAVDASEADALVAPVESSLEVTTESSVESLDDASIESPVESLVSLPVDSADESMDDAAVDAPVDAMHDEVVDATHHEAQAVDDEFDDVLESGREALVDEDPPVSTVDIPWLTVAEEEREAHEEVALADAEAEAEEPQAEEPQAEEPQAVELAAEEPQAVELAAAAESVDSVAVEEMDIDELQLEETVAGELASAPQSPAFVTETMAELLVAQGFVDRARTVYEELVSRRPYDAVLSSRLAELQTMKDTEKDTDSAAESTPTATPMPAWSATPIRGGTPVRSATPFRSRTPLRSSTPISATPISCATPVHSSTPMQSATPIASPVLPLVAPTARRTARELFATLAGMRVARRTPSFGSVTVAVPTPADGLASLFGETVFPLDDRSAHSLASAFGSGEGIEPGPSLFASAGAEDASRFGAQSTPARPSPVSPPHASGSAFSFDRFFPDPAIAGSSGAPPADPDVSQTPASGVASGSGDAEQSAGPSSAGADLAQFSHWLKGLSNS